MFLRDLLKIFSYDNLHSLLLLSFFVCLFILKIPSRVLPRHTHCLHSRDILQETGLKNVPHLPEALFPVHAYTEESCAQVGENQDVDESVETRK